MALTYRTPIRARERILGYGPPGVGKSNAILTVARRCPDSHFYVVDTEIDNYDRLLDTGFTDLSNVTVESPMGWEDVMAGVRKFKAEMDVNDWLIVDSMTPTWDLVQEWYIENIFGVSDDLFFTQARAAQQSGDKGKDGDGGLDGWRDWGVVNKNYFKIYRELATARGHVYLTAEGDKVQEPKGKIAGDDKETRNTFGTHGLKPKGQKRLGFIPHTVLLFSKTRQGEYTYTTVKDRGRTEVDDGEVTDFSKDYLVTVAGWKPTKVE